MSRRHESGAERFQIPLFLSQPLQLFGQQQGKGDFYHLRRADLEGNARKFQPRHVAGAVSYAQRGHQQTDEHDVEQHQPFPAFHHIFQVQHRHEDVGADADDHGRSLYAHIAQPSTIFHILGGTEDQYDAVQR